MSLRSQFAEVVYGAPRWPTSEISLDAPIGRALDELRTNIAAINHDLSSVGFDWKDHRLKLVNGLVMQENRAHLALRWAERELCVIVMRDVEGDVLYSILRKVKGKRHARPHALKSSKMSSTSMTKGVFCLELSNLIRGEILTQDAARENLSSHYKRVLSDRELTVG